jgi:hypothetical protein
MFLRLKLYYDCEIKLTLNLKDPGRFAVTFRVIDAFNYYAFILDSVEK